MTDLKPNMLAIIKVVNRHDIPVKSHYQTTYSV